MAKVDCAIIGAGPAGTALAQTLARAGRSVLMIERRKGARHDAAETLPPAAVGLARQLLDLVQGTSPSRGMISAWGADDPLVQDYFFTPEGQGLCVNRAVFDEALRSRAVETGVTLLRGAKLRQAAPTPDNRGWVCGIETGGECRKIEASYLVDATGRRAVLGGMLSIRRDESDRLFAYALEFSSLTASLQPGFARVEACDYGWWYCNAIPGTDRHVAMLHTDRDAPQAAQAGQREGFLALLAETKLIGAFLRDIQAKPFGRIRGAHAGQSRNQETGPDRFLAVGDAAQAFDPLSSQGVWRALASGVQAGQLLSYALANSELDTDERAFVSRYHQAQAQAWAHYAMSYTHFYASESRWRDQPFWARRSGPAFKQSQTLREAT